MAKYSWNKITIRQAQEINNILGFKKETPINKLINILCVINDKTPEYYRDEISTDELNSEMREVSKMLKTEIDLTFDKLFTHRMLDSTFGITYPVSKMTAGQFIDFSNFISSEPNNISLQLATLLVPKGGKYGEFKDGTSYDIYELAKEVERTFPFCKARGIANFFWQASIASKIASLLSSKRVLLMQKKKERDQEKKNVIQESIQEIKASIKLMKQVRKEAI